MRTSWFNGKHSSSAFMKCSIEISPQTLSILLRFSTVFGKYSSSVFWKYRIENCSQRLIIVLRFSMVVFSALSRRLYDI
jgi:hypothetical protein